MMAMEGDSGLDPLGAGPMFGALFPTRPEGIGMEASN